MDHSQDVLGKALASFFVESDGSIKNDKLNQVITDLKAEVEEGNERNINDMMQVDEYKLPGGNKDASTVNNSAYYESDEHEVEIGDSDKQVEAIKESITDTHSVNRFRNLSVGVVSVKPAVTGVGIIGRGGRGITEGIINNVQERCTFGGGNNHYFQKNNK